jgi:hypothetical protein
VGNIKPIQKLMGFFFGAGYEGMRKKWVGSAKLSKVERSGHTGGDRGKRPPRPSTKFRAAIIHPHQRTA